MTQTLYNMVVFDPGRGNPEYFWIVDRLTSFILSNVLNLENSLWTLSLWMKTFDKTESTIKTETQETKSSGQSSAKWSYKNDVCEVEAFSLEANQMVSPKQNLLGNTGKSPHCGASSAQETHLELDVLWSNSEGISDVWDISLSIFIVLKVFSSTGRELYFPWKYKRDKLVHLHVLVPSKQTDITRIF